MHDYPAGTLSSVRVIVHTDRPSETMNEASHESNGATNDWGPGATLPLADVQSIVPLILNVAKRDQVLARFDVPRRLAAEDSLQLAAQLTETTSWKEKVLLEKLGCEVKTIGDLGDATIEQLETCRKFLRLLSVLTGLVDIVADKRAVVVECAKLRKATDLGPDELSEVLKSGQRTDISKITPVEFIRLGEIAAAGDLVRDLVPATGTARPRPKTYAGPFGNVPPAHLSTTRIEMYVKGMRGALGTEVALHISAHLEDCQECKDAVDYCRTYTAADHGHRSPVVA